jgi:hypothetical protein
MSLSPGERSLRARMAAFAMHSQNDSKKTSQPARDAFQKMFLDEVDPFRELPEAERLRRAECARKAHFTRMAYRSAKVRRAKAAARRGGGDA